MPNKVDGNWTLFGIWDFVKKPRIPSSDGWVNADVDATADITADKVRHQFPDVYAIGTTVQVSTYAEQQGHIAWGSTGAVYQVQALARVLPGAGAPVYVDYQKHGPTTVSTWVSVLSAPFTIASTDKPSVPLDGAVTTGEYSTGFSFRWVIQTTAASSALGVVATAWHRQKAD